MPRSPRGLSSILEAGVFLQVILAQFARQDHHKGIDNFSRGFSALLWRLQPCPRDEYGFEELHQNLPEMLILMHIFLPSKVFLPKLAALFRAACNDWNKWDEILFCINHSVYFHDTGESLHYLSMARRSALGPHTKVTIFQN